MLAHRTITAVACFIAYKSCCIDHLSLLQHMKSDATEMNPLCERDAIFQSSRRRPPSSIIIPPRLSVLQHNALGMEEDDLLIMAMPHLRMKTKNERKRVLEQV